VPTEALQVGKQRHINITGLSCVYFPSDVCAHVRQGLHRWRLRNITYRKLERTWTSPRGTADMVRLTREEKSADEARKSEVVIWGLDCFGGEGVGHSWYKLLQIAGQLYLECCDVLISTDWRWHGIAKSDYNYSTVAKRDRVVQTLLCRDASCVRAICFIVWGTISDVHASFRALFTRCSAAPQCASRARPQNKDAILLSIIVLCYCAYVRRMLVRIPPLEIQTAEKVANCHV